MEVVRFLPCTWAVVCPTSATNYATYHHTYHHTTYHHTTYHYSTYHHTTYHTTTYYTKLTLYVGSDVPHPGSLGVDQELSRPAWARYMQTLSCKTRYKL